MLVLKNIAFFLTAVVLSKGFGFIQSFLVAKSLGPADFGVWVTLMLVVSYSPILCLGTVETLLKKVPFFIGRSDATGAQEVERGVMGSIVLSALLVVVLAVLAPVVLRFTPFVTSSWMVAVILITIASGYFSAFFYHRFAAYEDFKSVGVIDFVRSILAVALIGGMGWIFGLKGAVIGYFIHEVVMCLLTVIANVRAHGKVGVTFRRDVLVRAVRVGFPITLLWWCLTLTGSVDRVVLGSLLGPLSVGHYGLGVSVAGMLSLVPMVVGRVLYPKVNKRFGEEAGSESMKRIVLAPTLAVGTLLVNLQAVLVVSMPFLYNVLLPKYHPGLRAGQILMLGSFFFCLLRNSGNYLIAANQERSFLAYILITLGFNIAADVSLVKAGFGLEGVAIGTSLAGLLLSTLVWRRVLTSLGFQYWALWRHLSAIYLPIILLSCAVVGFNAFYPGTFETFGRLNVMVGFGLIIAVNAVLGLFPVYRDEMLGWKRTFFRVTESIVGRIRFVDAA